MMMMMMFQVVLVAAVMVMKREMRMLSWTRFADVLSALCLCDAYAEYFVPFW